MIKIALGQIEVIPGNPRQNKETILQAMQYSKAMGADILILPELAISGYLIGDLWEQPSFVRECLNFGEEISRATDSLAVVFGNVGIDATLRNSDGRLRKYNALYAAQYGRFLQPQGSSLPYVIKTLSPNYRFFDESRYFTNTPQLAFEKSCTVADLLGLYTFTWPTPEEKDSLNLPQKPTSYTIAPLICEDSWDDAYTLKPTRLLLDKASQLGISVDAFVNISSSPFTLGKEERRHRLFKEHSCYTNLPLIYVNPVGIQNNGKSICTFDGASTIYNEQGEIIETLPSFEAAIKPVHLPLKETTTTKTAARTTKAMPSVHTEAAQIYRALHYGIRTFLERHHIRKVVLGVSGGIDSAVNAALYRTILSPENIYLVSMPSRFNSAMTQDAAKTLAENLQCPFASLSIQDSITLTEKELTEVTFTATQADGQQVDEKLSLSSFVMENIQARDRSSRILAAVAAAVGGVFTCNGNKTELSIGFATLYGDLAGFLAATADLWKYQMYELAQYLNEEIYGCEVIPQSTIDVKPSAELSEQQDITKGLGDPLQYEYHDRLLRSFIEPWNRCTPEDIALAYAENRLEELLALPKPISHYFATATDFLSDLERWWQLQSGFAVAKRIQTPPLIVISRRAYGNDLHESQLIPYYTDKYYEIKERLLKE